ncbi:UGSC family (seleno)protein [Thermodesulfobacteriota bacterium]
MSVEKLGVPTVGVVTEVFAPLAKMYTEMVGIPRYPIAYVPQPVSRIPAPKCREYIEGNDPATGRPVIDELVEALTKSKTEEQELTGLEERPVPRLLGPDTEENLHRLFLENSMTDYLPIVLPTEERVAKMLKGTSHKPDEEIGDIRAGYAAVSVTVEKVAANAVMAGARPEYMPVILAMAASGVSCISTSTGSFSTTIVVNGPIRSEIGMNSGCGAMSPFNQANSVIGRVATLMSINMGGGKPGETYWGTQGNNIDYNHVTFAENEEALPPGWTPFHTQKGFKPEESAVSFFRATGFWDWKHTYQFEKHKALLHIANWVMPSGGLCMLLDPIVAESLVNEGYPTKESVSKYIYDNALITLEEFWQYHLIENKRRDGQRGIEPYATWLKQPQDTLITRYRDPDAISIFTVGGRTNDFWKVGDWEYMGSFSIDEWR